MSGEVRRYDDAMVRLTEIEVVARYIHPPVFRAYIKEYLNIIFDVKTSGT